MKELKPTATTADLKAILINQINMIARGEMDTKKAQMTCSTMRVVATVLNTEMRAANLARKNGEKEAPPVQLVQDQTASSSGVLRKVR